MYRESSVTSGAHRPQQAERRKEASLLVLFFVKFTCPYALSGLSGPLLKVQIKFPGSFFPSVIQSFYAPASSSGSSIGQSSQAVRVDLCGP